MAGHPPEFEDTIERVGSIDEMEECTDPLVPMTESKYLQYLPQGHAQREPGRGCSYEQILTSSGACGMPMTATMTMMTETTYPGLVFVRITQIVTLPTAVRRLPQGARQPAQFCKRT
jgi:hypothetical protein